MREIGVRELKVNTSKIMRSVRKRRARYIITYRGQPVGLLSPLEDQEPNRAAYGESSAWDELTRLAGRCEQRRRSFGDATLMARPFTVDASVFLNAFNPSEAGHAESQRALAWLQEQATPIIVPTLVLPKVAATIRRVRGDAALARDFVSALSRLPASGRCCRAIPATRQ